jgi:hypothetical protein
MHHADLALALLNNIKTNVRYFNDFNNPDDSPANAVWRDWGTKQTGWTRKLGFTVDGTPLQRFHEYPTDQPIKIAGTANAEVSLGLIR